jgi:hypothetical protein
MAMMFSSIPPSRSGPVDIFIVDIHALQERFYFDPRSSVINPISAIGIFIGRLLAKYHPAHAMPCLLGNSATSADTHPALYP